MYVICPVSAGVGGGEGGKNTQEKKWEDELQEQ